MKEDKTVSNETKVDVRIAVKTGKTGRGKVLEAKVLKERLEERKILGLS